MKRGRIVATLMALALLGPVQAREWIAVGAAFPRIFEEDGRGGFTGLGPAVLERVLQARGDRVRFLLYPWSRAQRMVSNGEADILIGPYATPERRQRWGFSRLPFYRDVIQFYGRTDRLPDWQGDYRRLAGLRVALVRGWTYGDHFRSESAALDPNPVENVTNGLRMLGAGRIDLLAANARHTDLDLRALGLQGRIAPIAPPIDAQDGYFAFPRDAEHDALRATLDQALTALRDDGSLARLAEGLGVTVP